MKIDKIIFELWEYVYNKHSINGVLIISREQFEEQLRLIKLRNEDTS